MSTETATFERAAAFRRSLAVYLGLPDGKDPDHVGITIGPSDEPVIGMPLSVAERLLADAQAAPALESSVVGPAAAASPHERHAAVASLGRALIGRMGREVTLIVADGPPVTGVVRGIGETIDAAEPDRNGAWATLATDLQGDVDVSLRDVLEVRAWSA